jgi:hypothetical protein
MHFNSILVLIRIIVQIKICTSLYDIKNGKSTADDNRNVCNVPFFALSVQNTTEFALRNGVIVILTVPCSSYALIK